MNLEYNKKLSSDIDSANIHLTSENAEGVPKKSYGVQKIHNLDTVNFIRGEIINDSIKSNWK